MANKTTLYPPLPHEHLLAYQVACDLLVAIVEANIRIADLRDQALRAARSACLNIAEANGRVSPADRKRVFAIARGEASEPAAAVHVAFLSRRARRSMWIGRGASAHERSRCCPDSSAKPNGTENEKENENEKGNGNVNEPPKPSTSTSTSVGRPGT